MHQILEALALKEIQLCSTQEELQASHKRWKEYFAAVNKFLAGKGPCPYFTEDGKIAYD